MDGVMDECKEERLTILDGKASCKARLCVSYRLLVWLVLGLGSTVSFTALSSQPAVFTCRRLASDELPGTQNPPIQEGTLLTKAETRGKYVISQKRTENETTDSGILKDSDWNISGVNLGNSLFGRRTLSSAEQQNETSSTAGVVVTTNDGRNTVQIWTKESEGWVLASISLGYYVIQLPAAFLAMRVGSCRLCLVATFCCVVTSLLSVPALQWGPLASAFVCLIKGASAGALFPALTSLASVWSGTRETSLVVSIVESGLQVGHAASFLAAAAFCDGRGGWANVFYAQAMLSAIFGVVFWLTVEEQPSEKIKCPWMTQTELEFLTSSMKRKGFSSEKRRTPYRSILTSMPVLAIVVAQLGCEWLDSLMVTSLPEFLGVRHGMNERLVELLTSMGFLLSIPVALVGAKVADWLLDNSVASASTVRKVFDVLSKAIPALCFLILSYLDSSQVVLVAIMYLLTSSSSGLTDSAWPANCLDLAPAYAGFLVSLGEWLTSWMWAVSVLLVAYIAPEDTPQQWQTVMYITAGLMCACILFYVIFASGELQKWAIAEPIDDSVEE